MEGNKHVERAPFHVSLEFESVRESTELAEELQTWRPTFGWSENAQKLFKLLKNE